MEDWKLFNLIIFFTLICTLFYIGYVVFLFVDLGAAEFLK
jgi:hypothetical protein